jgi:hypothetical protein
MLYYTQYTTLVNTEQIRYFVQWKLDTGQQQFAQNTINRKFRVATEIGSIFFLFSTNYRAAEIVQIGDYLSSA